MSLGRKILILFYVLVGGVFNFAVVGIAFHVPEAGDAYPSNPHEIVPIAFIAVALFGVAVYCLWVRKPRQRILEPISIS